MSPTIYSTETPHMDIQPLPETHLELCGAAHQPVHVTPFGVKPAKMFHQQINCIPEALLRVRCRFAAHISHYHRPARQHRQRRGSTVGFRRMIPAPQYLLRFAKRTAWLER